jgi:hypothetical protein
MQKHGGNGKLLLIKVIQQGNRFMIRSGHTRLEDPSGIDLQPGRVLMGHSPSTVPWRRLEPSTETVYHR